MLRVIIPFCLISTFEAIQPDPRHKQLAYYRDEPDNAIIQLSYVPVTAMINQKIRLRNSENNYNYELTPLEYKLTLEYAAPVSISPMTLDERCTKFTYRDTVKENCGLPRDCVALRYFLLESLINSRKTMACFAAHEGKISKTVTLSKRVDFDVFNPNVEPMRRTYPESQYPLVHDPDMVGSSFGGDRPVFFPKLMMMQGNMSRLFSTYKPNQGDLYISYSTFDYFSWAKIMFQSETIFVSDQISLPIHMTFKFTCSDSNSRIDALKAFDEKLYVFPKQNCGTLLSVSPFKAYCSNVLLYYKKYRCPLDYLPRTTDINPIEAHVYISDFPFIQDHEK